MIQSFLPFGARVRCCTVNPAILMPFLMQGMTIHAVVTEGFPPDAEFVRVMPTEQGICFVLKHPSFDLVAEGKIIPEQHVQLFTPDDAARLAEPQEPCVLPRRQVRRQTARQQGQKMAV